MDKIPKGTPTKERMKKINQIMALKLIDRNLYIYNSFEKLCNKSVNISYLFCKECEARDHVIRGATAKIEPIDKKLKIINKLRNIDKKLFNYWNYLYYCYKQKNENFVSYNYESYIEIEAYFLKEALGEDRFYEIPFYGTVASSGESFTNIKTDMYPIRLLSGIQDYLTDDDLDKIKSYFLKRGNRGIKTIVRRNYEPLSEKIGILQKTKYDDVLHVELDLSKPLSEIISFIKEIHQGYNDTINRQIIHNGYKNVNTVESIKNGNNTKVTSAINIENIKTVYDWLNIERKTFKAELHKYNIYIKNNRAGKNNIKVLTDILFVFDCIYSGLDYGQVQECLNDYYTPKATIDKDTIAKYYKFANDFISNRTYKDFISGASIKE